MRLFWTTTSIGPRGGAPVPSMTVTPRMTRRSNGPFAVARLRVGVGFICWAESDITAVRHTAEHITNQRNLRDIIASKRRSISTPREANLDPYSVRSAVIGSTRMARRAGTKFAKPAAATIAAIARPQAIGSNGVMP